MDQEKIGKFIAACRKEQGITQAVLAEKLGITDRAVSKWETGKSMPDSSLMLPLCGLLKINVNELLSGERLNMEEYQNKAEAHLVEIRKQEEAANGRLLKAENVIGTLCTLSFLLLVFTASLGVTELPWRIALILAGLAIFAFGIFYAVKLEWEAGYFECADCGYRYVPAFRSVVFALHIGRNRKMTCPHCGKKNYHKKVLTK